MASRKRGAGYGGFLPRGTHTGDTHAKTPGKWRVWLFIILILVALAAMIWMYCQPSVDAIPSAPVPFDPTSDGS